MLRSLVFTGFLVLSAALCGHAQSSGSGSSSSQSSTSSPAPGTNATPPPSSQAPDKDPKKPKKVWTNDELQGLNGNVSVVGDAAKTEPGKSRGTQGQASPSTIARMRGEVQKLRADLQKTDKQIQELKEFNSGEATGTGSLQLHHSYTTASIPNQIKQLEEKKKQIEARIAAIEDDARKRGIEPGQLR